MSQRKPTIHITSSAAAVQVRRGRAKPETKACVGFGGQINIRPKPHSDRGQTGMGTCHALTPDEKIWDQARSKWISTAKFKTAYLTQLREEWRALAPGALAYDSNIQAFLVEHGATLTCSCSMKAGREGECHRAWAAAALHLAGWRVVLDGVDLDDDAARALLEA